MEHWTKQTISTWGVLKTKEGAYWVVLKNKPDAGI
jgi:hypothetical protein